MKDNRPVNLDIKTIWLPIPAITSILHRISGVAIFFGVAILLCLLDSSLSSEENFANLQNALASNVLLKGVVWLVLCGFIYHTCAGIRHVFMDLGFGMELNSGRATAKAVFVVAIILMILAGVWIW